MAGGGLAAAPTVSFTPTPTSSTVYQTIVFDPTVTSSPTATSMKWQFGSDGNVNYSSDFNQIFFDNFNDKLYSPEWSVNIGAFSAASNVLQITGNSGTGGAADQMANIVTPIAVNRLTIGDQNVYLKALHMNDIAGANHFFGLRNSTTKREYVVYLRGGDLNLYYFDGNSAGVQLAGVSGVGSSVTATLSIDKNFVGLYNGSTFVGGAYRGDINAFTHIWFAGETAVGNNYVDDVNLYMTSSVVPIDLNQSHTFTTSGTKTVALTVTNPDGSTTYSLDYNVFSGIIFNVRDENTDAVIPTAIASFLGSSYLADSNGTITIPINLLNAGDYTVGISAPSYPARYFTYDLNAFSSQIENVYLLDSNRARSIAFLIRDENSSKYANRFFRILHPNGTIVFRGYSDNQAIIQNVYLANLVRDYNFFVDYNSLNGTNLFSYRNNRIRVAVPKNENTLENLTPFGVSVTDLTSIDVNNLSAFYDFNVYPNTLNPYKIQVDANALSYFSRYYNLRTLPKDNVVSLQPYLLRASDGAASASMTLLNTLTGKTIPQYVVKFVADVGSQAGVLVESQQTDSAGKFLFTTITGKSYYLTVLDNFGDVKLTGPFISSTDTTYFIDIFTGSVVNVEPTPGVVDFNLIIPETRILYYNASNEFAIRFKLRTSGPSVTRVDLSVDQNGTNFVNETFLPTAPNTTFQNNAQFDKNFLGLSQQYAATIKITAYTSSGVVVRYYLVGVRQKQNVPNLVQNFTQIQNDIGEFGGIIVWFLVLLSLAAAIRFTPFIPASNGSIIFVEIIWTLIAAWINLIPFWAAGTAILGAFAVWYLTTNRSVG